MSIIASREVRPSLHFTRLGPNYLLCLLQSLSPEGLVDKREARELKKREKRKTRMTETSAEREPTVMSKKKERTKKGDCVRLPRVGQLLP